MSVLRPADDIAALVDLARKLQVRMIERGLTLATAESCTGGLIAHALTEVSGASDYFVGGLVSYSDALKAHELDVPVQTLAEHGAVSAQTCLAMVDGARKRYGASLAIAVTGIAGPGGGSAAKPVGLTYIAVGDETGMDVQRHVWTADRHGNKMLSANAALKMVLDRLDPPRD